MVAAQKDEGREVCSDVGGERRYHAEAADREPQRELTGTNRAVVASESVDGQR